MKQHILKHKYFIKETLTMKKIDILNLNCNPFKMIGRDWLLITSGDVNGYNTMTASWGGLGVLWNKNTATIYIRPQRYTKEFVDKNELFTLSFFDEKYRPALNFCGTKSGRDYDKAKETGLTPVEIDGSATFSQAKLVLVCKKLYADEIKPEKFIDKSIEANYALKDYHTMYIAEIVAAYEAE